MNDKVRYMFCSIDAAIFRWSKFKSVGKISFMYNCIVHYTFHCIVLCNTF